MITALKKLTHRSAETSLEVNGGGAQGPWHTPGKSQPHAHRSPLNSQLQQKFSRGVDCNLQIVIRGDHGTGKTVLWKRLQGQAFDPDHQTTDEIQVASIHWNHKASDDIVKVDVWDVVDRGKKRKVQVDAALKYDRNTAPHAADAPPPPPPVCDASLDAEFLDVYKGTHGAVFLFNVAKPWTWDYVKREIPKVPLGIPILIMANFTDLPEERAITNDEVRTWMEEQSSPGRTLCLTESSLLSGLGLRYLHKFFSLPYLTLQRRYLEQQLATNQDELKAMRFELETCAPGSNVSPYHPMDSSHPSGESLSTSLNAGDERKMVEPATPSPIPNGEPNSYSSVETKGAQDSIATLPAIQSSIPDVDDFIPVETKNSIDSFLSEESGGNRVEDFHATVEDSEEDEDDYNPMVAKVQEDVNSD